jgi:hypothetical protein
MSGWCREPRWQGRKARQGKSAAALQVTLDTGLIICLTALRFDTKERYTARRNCARLHRHLL